MSAQANILLHVAGSMASGTSLFLDEPATKSRQIFTSKAANTQHAEAQVPSFGSFGTPEGGSLGHSYQAEDRPLAYKCGHSGVGGSDQMWSVRMLSLEVRLRGAPFIWLCRACQTPTCTG